MGPKGARRCPFSAAAILGRLWLIFINRTAGAGVSPDAGLRSIAGRGCPQESQYHGQGRYSGCDGKPRQANPLNAGISGLQAREPGGIRGRQVDDQADRRHALIGQAPDAETADFEHSGERRGRPHQQAAATRLHMDAVVADQAREGQGALQQVPDQPRFAGSRRARGSAPPSARSARRRRGLKACQSCRQRSHIPLIPAQAGIQCFGQAWVPASAGTSGL